MRVSVTLCFASTRPIDVTLTCQPGAVVADLIAALQKKFGIQQVTVYGPSRRLTYDEHIAGPEICAGTVLTINRQPVRTDPSSNVQLAVIGGPEAGRVFPLRQGTIVIGRDPQVDVSIQDPALSRHHVEIRVTRNRVWIKNLGAVNGLVINDQTLDHDPVLLLPDIPVKLGETMLTLVARQSFPALMEWNSNGYATIFRSPRQQPQEYRATIEFPAPPHAIPRSKMSIFGMAASVFIGLASALLWRNPAMLVMAIISSAVMFVGMWVQRRSSLQEKVRAQREYNQLLQQAQENLRLEIANEEKFRRNCAPDAAELFHYATDRSAELWQRNISESTATILRIGTADQPSTIVCTGALKTPIPVTHAVPATINLAGIGILGIAGPWPVCRGLARFLIAQLAILLSPRDINFVLLADNDSANFWAWLRWLPHLVSSDGHCLHIGVTVGQRAERISEVFVEFENRHRQRQCAMQQNNPPAYPHIILILDRAQLVNSDVRITQLLTTGPEVGIYALCLAVTVTALPKECREIIQLTSELGTRIHVTNDNSEPTDIIADAVSTEWSESIARALAPLREPSRKNSGLSDSVRFIDLIDVDVSATAIEKQWTHNRGDSLTATLGKQNNGTTTIDLIRDGPHALITGTTGSGKSELLQTLLASLAINHSPSDVSFLLIDYKGGAAFHECAEFPHTLGVLTDLDSHLTERMLRSLHAEISRREQLLKSAKASELVAYNRAQQSIGNRERLGRLIIVIDEFAAMTREHPEFLGSLLDIAQRGRSLGIHLLLATQRSAGLVTAEMRANISIRIALRVTSETDSIDVIGTSDASRISPSLPGRAFLSLDAEAPIEFHTAQITTRTSQSADATNSEAVQIHQTDWKQRGYPPLPEPDIQNLPTDLSLLVQATQAAARTTEFFTAPSPFTAPLATILTVADLKNYLSLARNDKRSAAVHEESPGDSTSVLDPPIPLGLIDDLKNQTQPIFSFPISQQGSLLVSGGIQSGRSTLLRTFAHGIAQYYDVCDLHLYLFDFAGDSLRPLGELPHCGGFADRRNLELGEDMLNWLAATIDDRKQQLAAQGFSSVREQRALAPPRERLAWLVVFLDSWEGFLAVYRGGEFSEQTTTLLRIIQEGQSAGIRIVMTSGRQGLISPFATHIQQKLILPLDNRDDYQLLGLTERILPRSMPPGRGILLPINNEVQIAALSSDASGPEDVNVLWKAISAARNRPANISARNMPFRFVTRAEAKPKSLELMAGRNSLLEQRF